MSNTPDLSALIGRLLGKLGVGLRRERGIATLQGDLGKQQLVEQRLGELLLGQATGRRLRQRLLRRGLVVTLLRERPARGERQREEQDEQAEHGGHGGAV